MIFQQYYLACLSHASYLIGDESTGRAVVVDPQRDVEGYVADAAAAGLTIERVIETHVHADFLSGHLELAAHTGATISYGEEAQVDFAMEPLRDGDRLTLGEVVIEILATPGHTPESICIVVYEHTGSVPYGVLTGDTLFVGDVGRPDLLASAGSGLTAEVLGRRLYRSLHEKLLTLPDATRVFPAHGAGSSCGKQLSAETSSTIGEQRASNYALADMTPDAFVAAITDGQPTRPHYFEYDVTRNRELRPLLDEHAPPVDLELEDVLARVARNGAIALDTREPIDFAAGHLRGAVNVGLQGRFAEFAGNVLDPERDVILVGDPATALETKIRLARIGFDRVVGQLHDPRAALEGHPERFEPSSRITIEQLAEIRGLEPDLQTIDVRNPGETRDGTVPGSRLIALPALVDRLGELDRTRPTVVFCASGYRSAVAASVLRANGFTDVSDLLGGYGAWAAAGLSSDRMEPASDVGHEAGTGAHTTVEVPEITVGEIPTTVASGALLLDVRELDEWDAGHAPGALHVPMREVPNRMRELEPTRRIVAICRSGGRSRAVAQALLGAGYDAVNATGGMQAWQAEGLPVLTDTGAPGTVA